MDTGAERSRVLLPERTTAAGFCTPAITMPGVGLVLAPPVTTGLNAGESGAAAAAGGVRGVIDDRIDAEESSDSMPTRVRTNEDEPDTRAESGSLPAGYSVFRDEQ